MGVTYRPRHQPQLNASDPYGGVNCSAYSAAIMVDRATIGGVRVTGKDIRAASNEPRPEPGSPGLNIEQVIAAAFRLTRVNFTPRRGSWSVMLKHLGPSGVLLPGDYDQIPPAFDCQPGFNDLHMVAINNENSGSVTAADGRVYGPGECALTYDPLCPAFRWVPLAVLRKYAEKYARRVGYTGGVIYATTRATPLIAA